jgi:uncharacterized protein (UPF0332 family)
MISPKSLLKDAELLLESNTTRPSQTSLRRALSTAYYALFHCLTKAAIEDMAGSSTEMKVFKSLAVRAIDHGRAKEVAKEFVKDVS